MESIASLSCVDFVTNGNLDSAIDVIKKIKPNIYCKGDDYRILKEDLSKKIIYEKNDRGWKGDIPYYRYSTKKLNKAGFKFHLNSYVSIKKAIKEY